MLIGYATFGVRIRFLRTRRKSHSMKWAYPITISGSIKTNPFSIWPSMLQMCLPPHSEQLKDSLVYHFLLDWRWFCRVQWNSNLTRMTLKCARCWSKAVRYIHMRYESGTWNSAKFLWISCFFSLSLSLPLFFDVSIQCLTHPRISYSFGIWLTR